MRSMALALIAVSAVVGQASAPPRLDRQQVQRVSRFYRFVISLKNSGVPSRTVIERMSPQISTRFRNLLVQARTAEDRHANEMKEPEPPLVEGSLFFSLFEGADRLGRISPEMDQGRVTCLVTLEYGDPKDPKGFARWRDRAVLIKERGRWVVDDLELLGKWPFGFKGKLSDLLREVGT